MKILNFMLGELRTNTYFVIGDSGECVVIDPGLDGEGIWKKLCEKELHPSHILLTHGHFDHEKGTKFLAEKTGAKICVHKDDLELIGNPRLNVASFFYRGETFGYPETHADIILNDGDVVQSGALMFTVIHTPGHTKGSVCFDMLEKILFTGDTLFSYGYGRTDMYGGDPKALADSLERIARIEGERKLYPGHGNSSYLSREREHLSTFIQKLQ